MVLRVTTVVSIAISLASVVLADHEIGYTESFSPNVNFTAEWCVDHSDIYFQLTAQATGWVAIGFSNNQLMPDSDIIMTTGEGEIRDAWALARAAPPADGSQDATLHAATQNGGQTIVQFSRPLDTEDPDDLTLNSPRFLLWAYNTSNDAFNQRHSLRGFTPTMLDFSAAATCTTPSAIDADFNDDGSINTADIDSLVMEIITGNNDTSFDLNGDTMVDTTDLEQWRSEGALANGFAEPYSLGDSNLDGRNDAIDLNALGLNWLQSPNRWSAGDFTADGIADAADLNALGLNWLKSIAPAANQVPEPSSLWLLGLGWLFLMRRKR